LRNIKRQIYHEYSGREQVPQYIQNTQNWVKWEIRPWQWLVTANEKNGELRGRKQPLWCQLFFEIYQMYLMYMITWYSTSMLHITVQDQAFCIYIWLHDITHPTPDLVPSAQTLISQCEMLDIILTLFIYQLPHWILSYDNNLQILIQFIDRCER
jgi:hypothetical protein